VSKETPGLIWPPLALFPTFQTPTHLHVYDLRGASHDIQLAVTTLAGLINRPCPRVYLQCGDDDAFWLSHALTTVPYDCAPQTGDTAFHTLLAAFRSVIQGLIVYDPALLDTVNVATTLAGQRDGLVVSPTLAQQLQRDYQLPVLLDLRTFGWKTRVQAYLWAKQNLLSTASTHFVAGLHPRALMGLRSFLVATRTFVYWLDARKRLPDRGADWLSERTLLQQILGSFAPGSAHLGWFIDENSGVTLTSQAAMPVLASDFFNNLEVWSALPAQTRPVAPYELTMPKASKQKVYLSFTISDGDNLQYVQHRMRHLWHDPARGSLPLGWTFSPLITLAAPALAAYYLASATAQDEFIAGSSGAGYMFPSHWPDVHLAPFLRQTGQAMQALGMTTLQVLDLGSWQSAAIPLLSRLPLTGMAFTDPIRQRQFVQALMPYGLRGVLSGSGTLVPHTHLVDDGTPVYVNLGLAGSVRTAIAMIKGAVLLNRRRPCFLNVYILAWSMTPSDLLQVVRQLGDAYEVVLPRTLLEMVRAR
jgi:hypothetical protein